MQGAGGKSCELLVVSIIAVLFLASGVAIFAVGLAKTIIEDSQKEIWFIYVATPGLGCLLLGLSLFALIIWDCCRSKDQTIYWSKKKGGYAPPPLSSNQ